MKLTFHTLIVVGLALLASPAIAKPGKEKAQGKGKAHKTEHPGKPGKGHEKSKPNKHPGKGNDKHHKFDEKEHLQLRNFFAPDNRKNLPPGLRKNLERGKPLPPGWQKKVAAGQLINNDWLKIMSPVSYDDLPGIRRSPGTRIYYHENRLVRVDEKTRVILDVINLLAR